MISEGSLQALADTYLMVLYVAAACPKSFGSCPRTAAVAWTFSTPEDFDVTAC